MTLDVRFLGYHQESACALYGDVGVDEGFAEGLRSLLRRLGEDPDRPGLAETPRRVYESLLFLTRGLREDAQDLTSGGVFDEESRDLVLVRDIEFVSLCEHHLLPFFGHVHVGYIPDGRILGLSRIARVVDHFACRPQVQERMTRQVADHLVGVLRPRGLGVHVTAVHLCMVARGVRKQDAQVVSVAWRGFLEEDSRTREDFLRAIVKG